MAKPTMTYVEATAARKVAETISNDNDRMMAVFKAATKGYTGDLAVLNNVDATTLNLFWQSESNVTVVGDLGINWNDFSIQLAADKIHIVIGKQASDVAYIHESPDRTSEVLETVGQYFANSSKGASQINYLLSSGDTLIFRRKGYSAI